MLEPRRIAVFISSCVCLLSAGSLFSFSSIGESLKARLGFSSSDLNVVSGIGNAALYVTFLLVGPMFDYCGPRITMLAAVFFFSLGYLLIWLAYEGRLASPFSTYGAVAFYYFLCGTGSSAAYMATIGVNVTNFPSNTVGKVVGVLLLFYGLSGTVYSQVYSNLYASNTGGYLLFLTTSTLVINFVCLIFITRIPLNAGKVIPQPSPDCKTINVAEVKKTLIASETRIEKMDSISTIPELMLEASESRKQSVTTTQANTNEIGAGLTKIDSMISLKNSIKASRLSLNPSQILRSPVFWMYTTAFTFQQGLTYITNLSSIVAAVDGTPGSSLDNLVALHITVTSVFQSAGRLLTGVIVDLPMFTSKRYDRSILFFYAMIFLTLPHLIVGILGSAGTLTQNLLLFCSACVGVGFGAVGGLFPPLTKDYFGAKYYGTACGFVFATVPIGIVLSNQLYGVLYDREAGGSSKCYRQACFSKSFVIFVALHAISVLSTVGILLIRQRERTAEKDSVNNVT